MRVLWITNIIFPAVSRELGLSEPVMGGWMFSSAKQLVKTNDVVLGIATVWNGRERRVFEKDGIKYYLLPSCKDKITYDKSLEVYWAEVQCNFKPDVIHIHGSEYAHGLAYIRSCGAESVVLSIQGLVSVCARYYLAGIPHWDLYRNVTIRDLFRGGVFRQQKDFFCRGKIEHEYIKQITHIIGRTSWDKAHALAINPHINYHFCNETLRDPFYEHHWEYDKCEKHTLFLSQAGYPIKGLHQVLKAMLLVVREYPTARLVIAGNNIVAKGSLLQRLKRTGYAKYIRLLIRKYRLDDNVSFTGLLDEKQICKQYLKANVFICPSSIENSPNSLGEAQLLGVPCVASYVGGVPDMIPNEQCGYLYRFEEIEMLATLIIKVFQRTVWDQTKMQMLARERHSPSLNNIRLIDIYRNIVGCSPQQS